MDSTDTLVEVDSTDAEIVARVAAIDVAKDSGMGVCAGAASDPTGPADDGLECVGEDQLDHRLG